MSRRKAVKLSDEITNELNKDKYKLDLYFSLMKLVFDFAIKFDSTSNKYYVDPYYMFMLRTVGLIPSKVGLSEVSDELFKLTIALEIIRRNNQIDKVNGLINKLNNIISYLESKLFIDTMAEASNEQKEEENKIKNVQTILRKDFSIKN